MAENKRVLEITGMNCQHCVGRVQAALKGVAGVGSVEVDLAGKSATVMIGDNSPSDADLLAAIEAIGYGARVR